MLPDKFHFPDEPERGCGVPWPTKEPAYAPEEVPTPVEIPEVVPVEVPAREVEHG